VALLETQIEGKYEILEKIKEGGMGAVYKVRHRFLDEIRVVKVIRAGLEATAELADRFQREARAAIRLRHPNIAQLHDFAVGSGGTAFIVMEYIDGLTLEDVLRAHGSPPLGLTLEVSQQALKAIGYLHRRGFVHRDIAPDNLMLTRGIDGEPLVKLIDLGIAKVLAGEGNVTSTGIFLGKPRYASPEHFGAEGGIDGRSDVYSFGVVLYELLTGEVPVSGRDPASFMAGHLLRPPRSFAETDPQGRVPSELRLLLFRALAKRAADRFSTAEDFARELAPLQARFPIGERELEEALQLPIAAPKPAASGSGSTQDRLNQEFGLVVTPTPRDDAGTQPDAPPLGETLALETARRSEEAERTRALSRTAEGETAAAASPLEPSGTMVPPVALAPAAPEVAAPLPRSDVPRPWPATSGRTSVLDPDWGDQTLLPTVPTRADAREPVLAGRLPAAGAAASKKSPGRPIGWGLALVAVVAAGAAWMLERSLADRPGSADRRQRPAAAAAQPPSPARLAPAPPTPETVPSAAGVLPPPARMPRVAEERAAASASRPVAAVSTRNLRGESGRTPTVASTLVPNPPAPPADPTLIADGPGVELAEPLSVPEALYPAAARGSGLRTRVLVAALIDEKGSVAEARVKSGDTSGKGFNEAALAAVRGARFLPATRKGVAGRSWTELMIEFSPPEP
jgi:TonB family protein